MLEPREIIRSERGGAGKGFLILLGAIALLAIAGFVLWKPVIMPLIGDAVPERLESQTAYSIPAEDTTVVINVPEQWVVQRGAFKPNFASIQSPDLVLVIDIESWPDGNGPSLKAGLIESLGNDLGGASSQTEMIRDGVVIHYAISTGSDGQKSLVALVGSGSNEDARAQVRMNVQTHGADLDQYLPSFAELLKDIEVKS